jgi:tRNA(Ile)-lysidine synthase
MGGRKKLVSDLLTDAHLSRAERESQMVLCVGDEIAWVVGVRSDERFRISPTVTEVLMVEKTEIPNQQE